VIYISGWRWFKEEVMYLPSVRLFNLGRMGYARALKVQEDAVLQIKEDRKNGKKEKRNAIFVVEHEPGRAFT
jgi:hypothetical protein